MAWSQKAQKKLGALAYIGTEATLFYCCLTVSKFTLFPGGGKLILRTEGAQAQIGRGPRGLKQAVTRQNTNIAKGTTDPGVDYFDQ